MGSPDPVPSGRTPSVLELEYLGSYIEVGVVVHDRHPVLSRALIGIWPSAVRYAPGASAGPLAGAFIQQTSTCLLAPAIGVLVISGYAAATYRCTPTLSTARIRSHGPAGEQSWSGSASPPSW